MKKRSLLFFTLSVFTVLGCNNANKGTDTKQIPKPGTIITSAEMPVTDDTLNHFTFSVKVVADSNISAGTYDVDADYGPNFAEGQFTMPVGGERLVPLIRKGSLPNTFIIGFKVAGDTTFYDYFEVNSDHNRTRMQYIKAYTF